MHPTAWDYLRLCVHNNDGLSLPTRVRAAFDVALKFHRNIQERDIEVGRNIGNWILRWLDRMKPSAQIRGPPEKLSHGPSMSMTNHGMKSSKLTISWSPNI
ncbi:hypothetical protein WN943_007140 [Citrus x changshan-huyou]